MRKALLVCVLIVGLGSLQSERPGYGHHDELLHHALHVVCFGVLAAMSRTVFRDRAWLVPIVLACMAFGAGLEYLQHAIYRNVFEWDDLRDDSIGAVTGVAMLALWSRKNR